MDHYITYTYNGVSKYIEDKPIGYIIIIFVFYHDFYDNKLVNSDKKYIKKNEIKYFQLNIQKYDIMKIFITNFQVHSIMERFYSKYKYRHSDRTTKKLPNLQDIIFIQAYTNLCIYSNQSNLQKENIIIKFKLINNDLVDEIISLNILYDDYKDLIK